jgi:2-polyprenyl-3-methyl-5-hydroxy-6-metoxy-1,4-benzoquinol methylase
MADQGTEGILSSFLRIQRLKHARPFISGRVLDIGCGTGSLCNEVSPAQYVGVDIDEMSIKKARIIHPKHHFQSFLPPENEKFDTIVLLAVIEHVKDPEEIMRGLTIRLKTNESSIVLTTPHPFFAWIHTIGATIGIFSRHANEEHDELLDYAKLLNIAGSCNLNMVKFYRFLFGANQLAVFHSLT